METSVLDDGFQEIGTHAIFTRRADPIPADLRLSWRVAAILLVVRRCRANTATQEQLHVLLWAIRSDASRRLVHRWFQGDRRPDDLIVRYDPSTGRTVNLVLAARLAERRSNLAIALTDPGRRLADTLWEHPAVFTEEKTFFAGLPSRISQTDIRRLMEWR